MSGPMSLREARTKQQKERSYKNSRLRFRASMKPQRNERSPSEPGDENNTHRKKIMKVDNTEVEGSQPNVSGSGSEDVNISISSAGDVDMSGGTEDIIEKEGTSTDPDVKETGDMDSDNMSIEQALEIVCGETEPDEPGTEDEASEDSMRRDDANKEEPSTFADESGSKKNIEEGPGAGDNTGETSQQEKGTGSDMPVFKDEEEDDKKEEKDDKKEKSSKDDEDSNDEDDGDDDGKKPEKSKKKDKDGDGSGGSDEPDGGYGNGGSGDKSVGGESKDDDVKDVDDNNKGGNDGQSSDNDFGKGGNGDGVKKFDFEDFIESSDSIVYGDSDYEVSDVEETQNSVEEEIEPEMAETDESEADSAAGKDIHKLNITEEEMKGITFDRGEGGGGNRGSNDELEKNDDIFARYPNDPYDIESDIDFDDDGSVDENFCEYLSGGSGGEDENSFHGDEDFLEEMEEVRGSA
ncbi:uncharacterized protein [Epargyreus clarus]|uniref:uncharacterized protein n=1 Tax=Epargyreus clarus TaxID=520877 RepID=UPI003C2C24FA